MKDSPFQAVKVSEHVWWVGAIDWELTDFHGYATDRGSTYNAFLVIGEKIALIDTVKADKYPEMMARIQSVIDPEEINYIVSNHSEMDHSGALVETINRVKPEQVFASKAGVKALAAHMKLPVEVFPVSDGNTLELGNLTLSFMDSKLAHWPDSMMTWCEDDKILFSNDIFGMHLASGERFCKDIDPWILNYEAAKYYANIFWPLSAKVNGAVQKVDEFLDKIEVLAPDHGPLWMGDGVKDILARYRSWVAGNTEERAIVVYDTMWSSTATLAHCIADSILAEGVPCKVMPLARTHRSDVSTELLEASTIIIGTPNLNGNILPRLADVLMYLKGLKPGNHVRKGAFFGSYGWSPTIKKQLGEWFETMKIEPITDGFLVNYVPNDETLMECRVFGKKIADNLKQAD